MSSLQEKGQFEGQKMREESSGEEESSESDDSTLDEVIPLSLRQVPSTEPSLEGDDSQLDDLMFMLKTQNYPHDEDSLFPESPGRPASEHLELMRISIADTHL